MPMAPELWHCQRCGGPVSSEAARRVGGKWVCPPCARTELGSVLARGQRGWAGVEQERRSLALSERRRERLIILMGAILILGVLCAVFDVPELVFRRRSRSGSHPGWGCRGNLRMIALACHMYAEDCDECFPERLELLHPGYVDNPRVFSCPSAPSSYGDFVKGTVTEKSSSYVLVSGLNAKLPPDTILAYDKSVENHKRKGRHVAFADAHVEWMREKEFQKRLKKQRAELARLKAAKE